MSKLNLKGDFIMITVVEKKTWCPDCTRRNQRVELLLKGLMSELGCRTIFVTWNDMLNEFTVFTGGSNMSDELVCFCNDEE